MEYKRLNIKVPVPAYNKLKEYCESVNAPLGPTMLLLATAQIDEMNAKAFVSRGDKMMKQMQTIIDAMQRDYTVSDPDVSFPINEQKDLSFLEHITADF